jgi:branched-chain amino acid transport system ATP-binding protein
MMALTLDAVGKRFGGVHAVEAVTFDVHLGHVTGLIGPNGAGKTTLINLITGMLSVTAGQIRLGATDITVATPHAIAQAGVARTFQTIRLLKESSVLDNVVSGLVRTSAAGLISNLLNLRAARSEAAEWKRRAHALLERFDMDRFAALPAGKLSYGHQRCVEIMRAIAASPSLLLLDEPAAGMNDVEAEQLGRIFRRLAGDGMGVLLVEHNMRLVMSLCDRVHVLDSGRLIASGTPAQVSGDPAVVAAYLGSA